MRLTLSRAAVLALLAAVVVFCVVQDRITAAAVGQYVALKRAELAGQGGARPLTIDSVMRPAIRRSVRDASIWAIGTFAAGMAAALVWIHLKSRPPRA